LISRDLRSRIHSIVTVEVAVHAMFMALGDPPDAAFSQATTR